MKREYEGEAHRWAATAGAAGAAVTRGVLRAGVAHATGVTGVDTHAVIVLRAGVAGAAGVANTLLLLAVAVAHLLLAVHAVVCIHHEGYELDVYVGEMGMSIVVP